MEAVYIDSEPPGPAGGGIRTYLRLALEACKEAGVEARIYSHAPEAFPGHRALPIGRKPWLKWPLRPLAYRLLYHDNVLWEHARWLADELEREDSPDRIYEFADFQGYGYFALRRPALRRRCVVRVHTPAWLTLDRPRGLLARLAAASLAYRERDCLMGRAQVTLPSAAFAAERLPWLQGGLHLPNPLPPAPTGTGADRSAGTPPVVATMAGSAGADRLPGRGPHILYLGRIEARKGVLTLLAGFLHLAKEDPEVSLTLVGGEVQPYAAKVRRLLEQCPPALRARVAWEPPCPPERRDALLTRFQVLAVPSLWENSPYVYFEGMAAGLLCVGSETGEMKETAAVTGGLQARPGEPEDWTRVLREAVGLARDPERLAAARAAQTAFLDERRPAIPGRMMELYRKLIEDAKEP